MNGDLTSLELAGFQVFEDLTHIPIKRITLLFGPNSAGKSAVEDALIIGNELLEGNFDNRHTRFDRLRLHWRRTGNDVGSYSEVLRLHLGIRITTPIQGELGSYLKRSGPGASEIPNAAKNQEPESHEAQIKFTFYDLKLVEGIETPKVMRDIEILINNKLIISFSDEKSFAVNFDHPLIKGTPTGLELLQVANKFSDYFSIEEGLVSLKCRAHLQGKELVYDFPPFSPSRFPDSVDQAATKLAYYFNNIKSIIYSYVPSLTIVPASRQVPTSGDLRYFISSDPECRGEETLKDFGISSQGACKFYELARSFASSLFPDRVIRTGDRRDHNREGEFAKRVNLRMESLFSEKGYKINMDFRVILDPEQYREGECHHVSSKCPGCGSSLSQLYRGKSEGYVSAIDKKGLFVLVRLILVDKSGREYSFSEVGSGVGYVLPILSALSKEIALLQQPELHLHPALQSKLGDVFIESTGKEGGSRKLMIETHSEHIMLRILRRIKQSYEAKALSDLYIEPDEVAVLYFDPRPNDTTRVTQLRISPDGDFIDRWPRGFFTERDEDLFNDGEPFA